MHPNHEKPVAGLNRRTVPTVSPGRKLQSLLASVSALALAAGAFAQGTDPAALAKYDTNHNGRIDPEERAAIRAADSPAATSSHSSTSADEPIEMSPFEVVESNRGYMATNTMSGTRVNTKLEDIASSISVVTKAQMDDFAMLDVNDIFNYEAGTEGSGNYTDFSVNASGQPQDNLAADPSTANRIRGLSSANVSLNGFETSRRVPVDRISVESVEVNRGPNSNLFGLGNASGTVNMVPARANTNKDRSQVQFRADAVGAWRESLDLNRVILKNKLAVRFTQVFQDDEFLRKPSGVKTERYNGMVTYRPFKSTTVYGTYQYYHSYGRRPNSVTPRDAITPWVNAGSPTWDPFTGIAYIDGKVAYNNKGKIPGYFTSAFQTTGRGTSLMFIDQDGIEFWTAPRGTATTTPLGTLEQTTWNYVIPATKTMRATQPLWATDDAVSDKSIYDWSSVNAIAANVFDQKMNTYMAGVDQTIFSTRRQQMAGQLSWFREDSPKWSSYFPNGSSGSTYLYIDPNIRRLDGSPNPFFLRPYFGSSEILTRDQPLLNDTLRAQLAYSLDMTHEKNWLRWLGLHQLTGFGEYKHFVSRTYAWQDVMLDNHAWLPAGMPRANSTVLLGDTLPQDQQSPTGTRSFQFYYVGDNQGNNIDYAPFSGELAGTYAYTWGNFHAGQVTNEPVQLGKGATVNGTAGAGNSLKIQKTQGAVLQSHFLNDRLVTTFGLRKDRVYTKQGVNAQLLPDGYTHDIAHDEQWDDGDYKTNQGMTRTSGAVLKLTNWLSVYANKSDSFIPADPAINLHGQRIPNPQGKGQDWGLMLNLFHGKLFLRANQFITRTMNDRNSASTTYAVRAVKMDIFDGQPSRAFSLDNVYRTWIQTAAGGSLPADQLQAKVAESMKMDPQLLATLEDAVNFNPGLIKEPEDALSKGRELEVTYNPTSYWTMRFNLTQMETIQSAVAQDLLDYLNERMPVWTSVIDPTYNQPWYSELIIDPATGKEIGAYGGQPLNYLKGNVTTPLQVTLAKVGKSLPQVRKYRANFMTSIGLDGITENRILRGFSVGGAVRWEDRGAIGYYGVQQPPEVVTELDNNRPVWDTAHLYVDAFVNYKTKLFKRVGTRVQLNVRNLNEQGHLQPVAAFPDGTPYGYRIIDPTQYILTVTFDF
jgi:outer membrane receptor for ferric coprogen and ferric-rhodotorulic acid